MLVNIIFEGKTANKHVFFLFSRGALNLKLPGASRKVNLAVS
jgi:hypothetical protein